MRACGVCVLQSAPLRIRSPSSSLHEALLWQDSKTKAQKGGAPQQRFSRIGYDETVHGKQIVFAKKELMDNSYDATFGVCPRLLCGSTLSADVCSNDVLVHLRRIHGARKLATHYSRSKAKTSGMRRPKRSAAHTGAHCCFVCSRIADPSRHSDQNTQLSCC